MSRDMRRASQQLSAQEAEAILGDPKNTHGVLAVNGDDGYPYAAPISFAWADGRVWVHMATSGHRPDSLAVDDRVTFTVVDSDEIVQKAYTTLYRSVIVFGRARLAESSKEHDFGLMALVEKYSPSRPEAERRAEVSRGSHAAVFSIVPEHITGKQARELVGTQKDKA